MEIDTTPSQIDAEVALRSLHCKLNAHTRTDGSALLAQGNIDWLANSFLLFWSWSLIHKQINNVEWFARRYSGYGVHHWSHWGQAPQPTNRKGQCRGILSNEVRSAEPRGKTVRTNHSEHLRSNSADCPVSKVIDHCSNSRNVQCWWSKYERLVSILRADRVKRLIHV